MTTNPCTMQGHGAGDAHHHTDGTRKVPIGDKLAGTAEVLVGKVGYSPHFTVESRSDALNRLVGDQQPGQGR